MCLKVLRNDGVCCVLSFLYVVSCEFEMCFGDDSVLRRRWLSEVLFRFGKFEYWRGGDVWWVGYTFFMSELGGGGLPWVCGEGSCEMVL